MSDEQEMALRFYGYGKWEGKYWFIGPEQGKGRKEIAGNAERVKAWVKLGRPDVCDIQKFHSEIGQASYFYDEPKWVPLQPTWMKLILVLLAALGKTDPTNAEARRKYQRGEWGRDSGETCVIELSGLAAKGFREEMDREQFLSQRIETIVEKIREHKPEFVVMYGASERERASWRKIAGVDLASEQPVKRGDTVFMLMPHTNTHGLTNLDWEKVGSKLHGYLLGKCGES